MSPSPTPNPGAHPGPQTHLRIARPVRNLAAAERFWASTLGCHVLYRAPASAEGGHALLMLGWPGAAWHLELVHDARGELPRTTGEEDLLVLYLGAAVDEGLVRRLEEAGGRRVVARNPYWERWGVTVADPDGYRVVFCSREWANV